MDVVVNDDEIRGVPGGDIDSSELHVDRVL
jgi:hypothetical protein